MKLAQGESMDIIFESPVWADKAIRITDDYIKVQTATGCFTLYKGSLEGEVTKGEFFYVRPRRIKDALHRP